MMMPAAAQLLWVRLITAMQRSQISVLRFGSDIMNQKNIAMFIQIDETEIETHMETLLARGLLVRDADGAIACPMLKAAVTRSEINRENGKKGGRPRKNPDPTNQTTLLLPIDGGALQNQKTKNQSETEQQTKTAQTPPSTTYLSSKEISKVSVSEDEWQAVGKEVLALIDYDPARNFIHAGPVRGWMMDGADREMILDVVSTIMNRPNPPTITKLTYFTKAIAERIAAQPPKKSTAERAYDEAVAVWEITGRTGRRPERQDFSGRAAA
jgi:hypothetical protein